MHLDVARNRAGYGYFNREDSFGMLEALVIIQGCQCNDKIIPPNLIVHFATASAKSNNSTLRASLTADHVRPDFVEVYDN